MEWNKDTQQTQTYNNFSQNKFYVSNASQNYQQNMRRTVSEMINEKPSNFPQCVKENETSMLYKNEI
jgi:Holliday junction resolvase RusA-like endonuclease